MATISYPAVGVGGLTEGQWAKMYDCPDGIVSDYTGGGSLLLTIISASNIARIAPGIACINGFYLEVTADEDLPVPTSAGTYYIVVQYDPTLNVADGSGNAASLGPCRLLITTSIDTSGGKKNLLLYGITRTAGQALSAATKTLYRIWVGPNLQTAKLPSAILTDPEGAAPAGFGPFPLGTTVYEMDTGETYRHVINSDGGALWDPMSHDGPYVFPANTVLVANDTSPFYYYTDNRYVVHLEGTLKRASGAALTSTGNDVSLGTMPSDACPKKTVRCPAVGKLASGWATVQIAIRTSGEVVLYDNNQAITYVDLSGVSFRVRS